MKALLVAESEDTLNLYRSFFESLGYDMVCYRWLLKALDNVDELKYTIARFGSALIKSFAARRTAKSTATVTEGEVLRFADENFSMREGFPAYLARGTLPADTMRSVPLPFIAEAISLTAASVSCRHFAES